MDHIYMHIDIEKEQQNNLYLLSHTYIWSIQKVKFAYKYMLSHIMVILACIGIVSTWILISQCMQSKHKYVCIYIQLFHQRQFKFNYKFVTLDNRLIDNGNKSCSYTQFGLEVSITFINTYFRLKGIHDVSLSLEENKRAHTHMYTPFNPVL